MEKRFNKPVFELKPTEKHRPNRHNENNLLKLKHNCISKTQLFLRSKLYHGHRSTLLSLNNNNFREIDDKFSQHTIHVYPQYVAGLQTIHTNRYKG